MLPEARLCHDAHGRTRFRFPSQRGNASFFSALKERLSTEEGVTSVETNPATASLLVLHRREGKAIVEMAEREGLFQLAPPPKPVPVEGPGSLGRLLATKVGSWDDQVKQSTRGAADLKTVLSLTLAGLGFFQAFRGNYLAPASTLLSDALKVAAI